MLSKLRNKSYINNIILIIISKIVIILNTNKDTKLSMNQIVYPNNSKLKFLKDNIDLTVFMFEYISEHIYSNSNNILAKYIYLNKLNLTEIESKQLKRKIAIILNTLFQFNCFEKFSKLTFKKRTIQFHNFKKYIGDSL